MSNHLTPVSQLNQTAAAAAGLVKTPQKLPTAALKAKSTIMLNEVLADEEQAIVAASTEDNTTTENSNTPSVDTLSLNAVSTDENAVSGATAEELNASSGQGAPEAAGGFGAGIGSIPFATMVVVGTLGLSQTAFDDDEVTEIKGTPNSEALVGDGNANKMYGYDGDDTLSAGGGNDELNGGLGANSLDGGEGSDTVVYQNQYPTESKTLAAEPSDIGMYVDLNYGYAEDDGDDYIWDNLVSIENVITGNGNDSVNGNEQANYISVGDGYNYAYGEDGNDTLIGGNDYNSFYGGNNNDSLVGGSGYDNLYGDDGNDTLTGGEGNDYMDGGYDNDSVLGGSGEDYMQGGQGNDTLSGGAQNDTIYGNEGNDYIDGGTGFDYFDMYYYGEDGSNTTVNLTTGIASSATEGTDTLVNIEGVSTSYGDDLITGNDVANNIDAGSGSNTVYGMGGDDTISAYSNNGESQYLDGGQGNDNISIYDFYQTGSSQNTVYGGAGNDSIQSYSSNPLHADGGADNDTLIGTAGGADSLLGGAGDDVLIGGGNGNDATDTIDGGEGNDTWLSVSGNYLFGSTFDNISGIEKIDLTNEGTNADYITLTVNDVLDMSETSNTLIIAGDEGDAVTIDTASWTQGATQQTGFDGNTYDVYTNGTATLLIDADLTVSPMLVPTILV